MTFQSIDQARNTLIDRVDDFDSAVAISAIMLRLTGSIPTTLKQRLVALDLRDRVQAHFTRLHREPDFDQVYAVERVITAWRDGASCFMLSGPAGSGKSYTLTLIYRRLIAELGPGAVTVTSPTNMGVNVLAHRGLRAKTNHSALYELGFGPAAELIRHWLTADGVGALPEEVSPRLTAAWRHATQGARERAARQARQQRVEAGLRELGLGGGLMDILPPIWELKDGLEDAEPVAVWIVDEASMMTSATLDDIRRLAHFVVLVGDPFQLPAIIEPNEALRGVTGAMAQIPPQRQVHLYTDRRTSSGTRHLEAANAILRDDIQLADLDAWARDGRLPGFGFARSYDAGSMIDAPVLSYYRNTGVRLSVPWRQFAGLPDDQLMPGERLIVDSVSRDQRDQLAPLGITKNARVVVLEQRSRYQALIVAESALDADADRETLLTSAITVSLGVSYPAEDLRNAGVVLSEQMIMHGRLEPIAGQTVIGKFAAASTTHKAQGNSFRVVQLAADDYFGYARSRFGTEIAEDMPIEIWRRLVYTAITRAEDGVIWVREGAGYRTTGARLHGTVNASLLEASLPVQLRGLAARGHQQELDAALAETRTPIFSSRPVPEIATAIDERLAAAARTTGCVVEDAPEPPTLPVDLLVWLFGLGDQLPRQLPGQGGVFQLHRGYGGVIEVVWRDADGHQRRRGLLHPDSPTLTKAHGRSQLDHADAETLTRTLRRLQVKTPDVFAGLSTCGVCGRKLTDPVSLALGVGPVCSKRLGLARPDTSEGES